MQDRFPQRSLEARTFDINAELFDLRQQSEETLPAYYKRARSMMKRVGARDRPETGIPLLPLEMSFLDGIIRSVIKGIRDLDVKKEAARGLSSVTGSFYSVYAIAEEARRTKVEITKLADAEVKEKQLRYYKSLAEKNTLATNPPIQCAMSIHKPIASKSPFYWASFEVTVCQAKRKRSLMRHLVIFPSAPIVKRLVICGASFGAPIFIRR